MAVRGIFQYIFRWNFHNVPSGIPTYRVCEIYRSVAATSPSRQVPTYWRRERRTEELGEFSSGGGGTGEMQSIEKSVDNCSVLIPPLGPLRPARTHMILPTHPHHFLPPRHRNLSSFCPLSPCICSRPNKTASSVTPFLFWSLTEGERMLFFVFPQELHASRVVLLQQPVAASQACNTPTNQGTKKQRSLLPR